MKFPFSAWLHPNTQGKSPLRPPTPAHRMPAPALLGIAARYKPILGTPRDMGDRVSLGNKGCQPLPRLGESSHLLILTHCHSLLPLQPSPSLSKTPGMLKALGERLKLGGSKCAESEGNFLGSSGVHEKFKRGASPSYWRNITAKCFRGCFTSLIVKKLKR